MRRILQRTRAAEPGSTHNAYCGYFPVDMSSEAL